MPLLIVLLYFFRGFPVYFGQYLTVRADCCVIRDLRQDLTQSVNFRSLDFFHQNRSGLILSRILNDTARIQGVATNSLADAGRVGAMVPFILIEALVHDWRMSPMRYGIRDDLHAYAGFDPCRVFERTAA